MTLLIFCIISQKRVVAKRIKTVIKLNLPCTLLVTWVLYLIGAIICVYMAIPIHTKLFVSCITKGCCFLFVLSFIFKFSRSHYLKKMESVWTTCVDDIPTVYLHYSQTERKVK